MILLMEVFNLPEKLKLLDWVYICLMGIRGDLSPLFFFLTKLYLFVKSGEIAEFLSPSSRTVYLPFGRRISFNR